jgi:hypothetical protein
MDVGICMKSIICHNSKLGIWSLKPANPNIESMQIVVGVKVR